MKPNKKQAEFIIVKEPEYEYIKAVRKPESNLKITKEFWFKGNKKSFDKLFGVVRLSDRGSYIDFSIENLWHYLGIEDAIGDRQE